MKSKKMTFVLILSVACVWGIIFYKVFTAAGAEDEYSMPVADRQAKYESLDAYVKERPEKLALNYSDPFLSDIRVVDTVATELKPVLVSNPVISSRPAAAFISRPAVNWSIIKYNGFINNPERKSIVCIMSINGKEYMLSEGESADGVKLLKISRDSVQVSYQQNTRFIKLQL